MIHIEDMPADVKVSSRRPASPVHEKIEAITQNENYHGSLKKLAEYDLPAEKGKAHQQKQNMTNYYGNRPEILGFSFVVTRSVNGDKQYLGVTYDPSRIVEGEWDAFKKNKTEREAAARQRKEERRLKAEARAEIDRLENEGEG